MENFKGSNTTDQAKDLFADDEYELWPEVCSECNCKLAEAQNFGCNVCRPAATRKSDSTVERGSERTSGGDSKRSRAVSKSDEEEGRSSKPKTAVARSPVHDFRELPPEPKHSGGTQTEVRKNRWHQPEGTRGSHSDADEPRHEVDSQLTMARPRCHDEPRLRAGYTRDMDKYMQEHMGTLLPLRTVADGPLGLDLLPQRLVQLSRGHHNNGRQHRDGLWQTGHHHQAATTLGVLPEGRRKDSHQSRPPSPGQHHLGAGHKDQQAILHHRMEVALGTLRKVRS